MGEFRVQPLHGWNFTQADIARITADLDVPCTARIEYDGSMTIYTHEVASRSRTQALLGGAEKISDWGDRDINDPRARHLKGETRRPRLLIGQLLAGAARRKPRKPMASSTKIVSPDPVNAVKAPSSKTTGERRRLTAEQLQSGRLLRAAMKPVKKRREKK